MSKFYRESNFKNVNVSLGKRETFYEQLKVYSDINNNNNGISCNSKYLVYIDNGGGGSNAAVLPLTSTGKNHVPITASAYQQPMIRHSQTVVDICFNPFNNNQLFTCANGLYLWNIPDGGYVKDETTPEVTFSNNGYVFKGINPHIYASNIVLVRGIKETLLYDISGSTNPVSVINSYTNELQSSCWSYSGDLIAVTTKDKLLNLCDIRSGTTVSTAIAHDNHKNSKCVWLGNSNYVLTTGYASTLDREYAIWDSRNLSTCLKKERIDSTPGMVLPFYDLDTNLVVMTGKGSTSFRLYEFDVESAGLFGLCNTPTGDESIKGAAILPKQSNDLMSCELMKILKLTEKEIQTISCIIPRRERLKFHSDLYPPSHYEALPALTAEEWLNGANSVPNKISINPPQSTNNTVSDSFNINIDNANNTDIESDKQDETPSRLSNLGSNLKYKHLYGNEYTKAKTFTNLFPNITSTDYCGISCNDVYWAIPWRGSGGPVYVSRLDDFGKADINCSVLNGHKLPITDIAFSPFHKDLMVTASDDSTIKLWKIPEKVGTPGLEYNYYDSINGHTNSIRTINFHPLAQNLLVSSSSDGYVKLWDINEMKELQSLSNNFTEAATVSNVSFNYDGSQMAIACKDRVVRVYDPRADKESVVCTPSGALGRSLRAVFCSNQNNSYILTSFSATSGMRQLMLWDPRNITTPLATRSIDNASGVLFPMYDEETDLCMIAGRGDTIIRHYEMTFLNENNLNSCTCNKAGEFQSSKDPITGICMLPKKMVDVKNVEVNKLLKLTENSLIPISFYLPRADNIKQYFQDDIYRPIKVGSIGVDDYVNYHLFDMSSLLKSMQPEDMVPLSEKPVEVKSKLRTTIYKEELNKANEESKQRDLEFNRLQELAIQRSKYHVNKSGGGGGSDSDNDWDNY